MSVESDVQQWLVEVKWEGTVDREEGVEEEGRSCELIYHYKPVIIVLWLFICCCSSSPQPIYQEMLMFLHSQLLPSSSTPSSLSTAPPTSPRPTTVARHSLPTPSTCYPMPGRESFLPRSDSSGNSTEHSCSSQSTVPLHSHLTIFTSLSTGSGEHMGS